MFSVKTMMRSAVAVGGALVLLASGASAASATTFTPTGSVVVKASSTNPIKLWVGGNQYPLTCLPGSTAGTGSVANSGGTAYITSLSFPAGSLSCTYTNGTPFPTTITMLGQGFVNHTGIWGTNMPSLNINTTASAPWSGGLMAQPLPVMSLFPAQFTNGTTGINGANPSTLTVTEKRAVGRVNDTMFGYGSTWMFLSGTFNVGTATAPVTVS